MVKEAKARKDKKRSMGDQELPPGMIGEGKIESPRRSPRTKARSPRRIDHSPIPEQHYNDENIEGCPFVQLGCSFAVCFFLIRK